MNCGVLDDAHLEDLLITSFASSAFVVVTIIVIIIIAVVFRRGEGEVQSESGIYCYFIGLVIFEAEFSHSSRISTDGKSAAR